MPQDKEHEDRAELAHDSSKSSRMKHYYIIETGRSRPRYLYFMSTTVKSESGAFCANIGARHESKGFMEENKRKIERKKERKKEMQQIEPLPEMFKSSSHHPDASRWTGGIRAIFPGQLV